MKKQIVATLMVFLMSPVFGWGSEEDPNTLPNSSWVIEEQKTVYFAPQPKLQVSVQQIAASDEYWDSLDVEMKYQASLTEKQAEALQRKYPGYQIRRVVLGSQGEFQLEIPSAKIHETLSLSQAVDGPYLSWRAFISRAASKTVRAAIQKPGFLSLTGNIKASVPQVKVMERVELGLSVCEELTRKDGRIFDVFKSFAAISQKIDRSSTKYTTTREALKKSVLENCVEIDSVENAQSFRELLSARVIPKKPASRPYGETKLETVADQAFGLKYQLELSSDQQSGRQE